jgi:hypothetical protein
MNRDQDQVEVSTHQRQQMYPGYINHIQRARIDVL